MPKHASNGRSKKGERHVRIPRWIQDCERWWMLSSHDKVVWIEGLRLYDGLNNGFLALPSRTIADRMNVAHQTVARSLLRLITLGFLEVTARSSFSNKNRKATEYRYTHLPCNRTSKPATRQFMRPISDPHVNITARDSSTSETVRSHP
jgi:hypothetical protein